MRAKLVLLGIVACAWPGTDARAGHVSAGLTREDGMNAVRLGGQTHTLLELIDRRSQAPARFDQNHPRLGMALSLGIEGLLERQALNERRFNRWHPLIAYLMADHTPDGRDFGGLGGDPRITHVLPSIPDPLASSIGPTPMVVPEPGSLLLVLSALTTIGLLARRPWRPRGLTKA